jgi:hypothetical protein
MLAARRRARRFPLRDGLEEISMGLILLLQGLARPVANSGSIPGIVIYFLALFAFAIYARRIVDAVRARITYPRIGYVRRFKARRWIVVSAILMVVAIAIGVGVLEAGGAASANPTEWVHWVPALCGLGLGAGEIYLSMHYGFRRFLVVGIFAIILGVVISMHFPWLIGLNILCAGLGCASLCSGGLVLRRYLGTTPSAANET